MQSLSAPTTRIADAAATAAAAPHIVVVDDAPDGPPGLEVLLTLRGFTVAWAGSLAELQAIVEARPVDLVLLDLPGDQAASITRYLREETGAGIILLTSPDADIAERVVGLELGADDCMAKPVDPREMFARIKSVLRRAAAVPLSPAPPSGRAATEHLRIGRFMLDLASHELRAEDGTGVPLTSMEFDLLKALATHPGKALTRDQILDLAHGRQWSPYDRSIDLRIARLRRKIEADPAQPRMIRTVRGVGYMFVPEPA